MWCARGEFTRRPVICAQIMGVIWFETPVLDLDQAQAFYADVPQVNLERRVLACGLAYLGVGSNSVWGGATATLLARYLLTRKKVIGVVASKPRHK